MQNLTRHPGNPGIKGDLLQFHSSASQHATSRPRFHQKPWAIFKMFLCISTVLSFIIFVAANTHLETRNQCKTGSIQCCNSLQQADQVSSLLSEVGVTVAQAADQGLVGVTCTPLTVVGTGTGCAATQQTVCCLNTNFNGVVNLGCTAANAVA